MLRALLLLTAFVAAAASPLLYRSSAVGKSVAWGLLAAALCLGAAGCWSLSLPGTALDGPSGPTTPRRRRLGLGLALAGIALWIWAPWVLLSDWNTWFTPGWLAWVGGTILLGTGLDLAWARWQWPARPGLRLGIVVGALGAAAALYRFGTFYFFPAESHITQIEELQVGAMGSAYLRGWRQRWEYLSHAWLAAIGLWLGGPSLFAMRAPFAAVSVFKIVPFFLWLRFSAGNAAAVVGTALLAFSAWDVTYARVPTNQNAIVIAAAFALLAGPARRGRPSAYVWLGLLGGYVLYEYVGYRLVGLFAIAGGLVASLRHASDPWWARLGRPLLTIALIAVMGSTLYLHLTRTGQMHQYYDGWGRARANQTHYGADDSPMERLEHIRQRSARTLSLFYFHGDETPVRNPRAEPMIDPATATLLVLGVGYGLVHPVRHLAGLTVVALAMTLGGTLVATGNFDPVRAGGAVPFVYGLAGYGAAALLQAFTAVWGAWGRRLAITLLSLAVLAAWADNTRFLRDFVSSPLIRKNQFRHLAYLSAWIGRNARPGEVVLAIAPGHSYAFEGNDAVWLRGVGVQGTGAWDIASALSSWGASSEPTLFFVYAGSSTPAVRRYLGWLLPSLPLDTHPGPAGADSDISFVHLPGAPDDLPQRLEAGARCSSVTAEFEIIGDGDEVLVRHEARLPFVDSTTLPHAMQSDVWRQQAKTKHIRAQFNGEFEVESGGAYAFTVEIHPGSGDLFLDGEHLGRVGEGQRLWRDLEPGPHRFELRAIYLPRVAQPTARLLWEGPATGGEREIMPVYLLNPNQGCRRD
jgi:hypothetical protein